MVGTMAKRNKKNAENIIESDETFAFIAGYTSGGFPYGITWEEMEHKGLEEQEENLEEDLPFD